MRAAIYARYSSDLQRDASIEDQVRLAKERISREGWQFTMTYSDRAQSGASPLRRGYQNLLEDARRGKFDIVVAEALDRLSRDQEDVAGLYKHLCFAGVKLLTIAEGEISELHVGLKGTMNALYLKDLAQKVRRGLRGRVEAGRSGGGICYGYDVVRELDARGEPIHGGRSINAVEAEVVRRILGAFASGQSPRQIAFELNAAAIPAPGGAGWGASTINGNATRGTGILNNELYIGRLIWNRLRYMKDPSTGRRISRLNPESAWITQEVPALRLVDDELWHAVKARQKKLAKNTRPDCREERPFWARTRPKYLFSRLMRCGACGGAYTKISANLFGCAAARNKGTCGNRLNIRRDVLEATVLDGLKHRLLDPDLYKVFFEEFIRETNRLRSTESSKPERAKADLAAIERRLRKIVDAIADGAPVRTLKDELMALEARQDELRDILAQPVSNKPLLHPNLAELYRQKVADLADALQSDDTRLEAMEIIRSLVEAILLVPEDGALRVEVRGELAGILALADSKKPAADIRDGLEQIKVVAGARNQRYLQI